MAIFAKLFGRTSTAELGAQARSLVASGAILLDVRTPAEFASGHIEGAVNVPVDRLQGQHAMIGPSERAVVVYCLSGARSAAAAQLLRRAGYSQVFDLGAIGNW